jgi:hypothetical protein
MLAGLAPYAVWPPQAILHVWVTVGRQVFLHIYTRRVWEFLGVLTCDVRVSRGARGRH